MTWEQLHSDTALAWQKGDWQAVISLSKQELRLLKEVAAEQKDERWGLCYENLGFAYDELKYHQEAEPFYQQALLHGEQNKEDQMEAYLRAIGNLGYFYKSMGDYERAIEFSHLYLEESAKETSVLITRAMVLNSLADMYEQAGDSVGAEKLYLQALEELIEGKKAQSAAFLSILSNLGWFYKEQGFLQLAQETLEDADSAAMGLEEKFPDAIGFNLRRLGGGAFELQRLEESKAYLWDAICLLEAHGQDIELYCDCISDYLTVLISLEAYEEVVKAGTLFKDYLISQPPYLEIFIYNITILGLVQIELKSYEDAIETLLFAEQQLDKIEKPEKEDFLNAYWGLGVGFQETKAWEKAETYFRKFISYSEKVQTFSPEYPSAWINIGLINLYDHPHPEVAVAAFKASIVYWEKKGETTNESYYINLYQLGLACDAAYQFEQAHDCFEQALAFFRKEEPPDLPSIYEIEELLFALKQFLHTPEKIEPFLAENISFWQIHAGEKHPFMQQNRIAQIAIKLESGKFKEVEKLLVESYTNCAPEDEGYSNLKYLEGVFLMNIGNTKQAEGFIVEGLELEKLRGQADSLKYAKYLEGLGRVYAIQDQHEKAKNVYLEAIKIKRKEVGLTHPEYAMSLQNLGITFQALGDNEGGERFLARAADIYIKIKQNPDHFSALNLLAQANTFTERGDLDSAKKLHDRALSISKKVVGKHPDRSIFTMSAAFTYHQSGNYKEAWDLYKEMNRQILSHISDFFAFMSEKEKQNYLHSLDLRLRLFSAFVIDAREEMPFLIGELYDMKLATKAIVMDTSRQARLKVFEDTQADNQALLDSWKHMRRELAKLHLQAPANWQAKEQEIARLTQQINLIERKIAQKGGEIHFGKLLKNLRWDKLQRSLDANEAVIEVLTVSLPAANPPQKVYLYLFIRGDSKTYPHCIIQEEGFALEEGLKHYQTCMRAQKSTPDHQSYHLYWQILAPHLKGIRKVYFASDGVYHLLNLNTLFNPETSRYLLDEIEICEVISSRYLLDIKSREKKALNPHAVLVGDIQFSLQAEAIQAATFPRLPYTQIEVQSIQSLLQKRSWKVNTLTGKMATKATIEKIASPGILHFATHGFFFSPNKDQKIRKEKIEFSKLKHRSLAGAEPWISTKDPLLRTGLALAGANDLPAEQGLITAFEVMGLDLRDTDLVILSACETGLGKIVDGEGVFGLQRGFLMAGAKTLIMSLWKVPDEATQELFVHYYKYLTADYQIQQAFLAALQELRQKYIHPFYWGGFVLIQ